MKKINYNAATFTKSCAKLEQLPKDSIAEVAFVGRSNAGKSSALNTITGVNRLARTSKTPGRTQLINFFALGDDLYLVDLPGYGFAKVPDRVKRDWEKTLTGYLETRKCLRGIILLMDIRHPMKPFDVQMLDWTTHMGKEVHILLTKADKLKRNQQNKTLFEVKNAIKKYDNLVSVQVFSATENIGLSDAKELITKWLNKDS